VWGTYYFVKFMIVKCPKKPTYCQDGISKDVLRDLIQPNLFLLLATYTVKIQIITNSPPEDVMHSDGTRARFGSKISVPITSNTWLSVAFIKVVLVRFCIQPTRFVQIEHLLNEAAHETTD